MAKLSRFDFFFDGGHFPALKCEGNSIVLSIGGGQSSSKYKFTLISTSPENGSSTVGLDGRGLSRVGCSSLGGSGQTRFYVAERACARLIMWAVNDRQLDGDRCKMARSHARWFLKLN